MPDQPAPSDREFAEWYVWAKREVSSDGRVCLGAAAAAMRAVAGGADRAAAGTAARRSTAGHGVVLAAEVPARRRAYAEWFDWARREHLADGADLHTAAGRALALLEEGWSAVEVASGLAQSRSGKPAEPAAAGRPAGGEADDPRASRSPRPGWRRVAAGLADGALTAGLALLAWAGLAAAYLGSGYRGGERFLLTAWLALALALAWLYHVGLETSAWQATLGKRWLGLKVATRLGGRPSVPRSSLRLLVKAIFPPGALWLLWRSGRAIHDLAAGTVVVEREAAAEHEPAGGPARTPSTAAPRPPGGQEADPVQGLSR